MRQTEQVVRAFLAAVQDGCGADLVSVFVPTWPGMEEAILAHSGPEAAAAELSDVQTAFEFARAHVTHDGVSAVTSASPGGALLPIPLVTSLWHEPARSPGLRRNQSTPTRRSSDRQTNGATAGWIALRFSADATPKTPPHASASGLAGGQSALGLAARLASLYLFLYDRLADPLTGLPGRSVLRALLRHELGLARAERVPLSLLLFNPDDVARVNTIHGRTSGDQLLREVVSRAQATLRRTDVLCRHGAAVFAVMLSNSSYEAASIVAGKLRSALTGTPYLDERIALSLSIGIASLSSEDVAPIDPLDFITRAEAALAAARHSGGARVCVWRHGSTRAAESLDRLCHAFTGDQDRDYRNMGLLWDAVGLLATGGSPLDLAKRVTRQLQRALAASLVVLFEPDASGLQFRYGLARPYGQDRDEDIDYSSVTPEQRAAVTTAGQTHEPVWSSTNADGPQRAVTCALPLLADGTLVGVLLLAGTSEHMTFGEPDLPFVTGFAGLLGLALQRARSAERRRQQEDLEKRRLVGELKGLKTALRQARLVYVSAKMEDLIVTARRVADTDATVLITGESGTGKELIAQTIHQMSGRRDRPFVVVDCGAIPSTLIESELFGHERGAFTGALNKSLGRLAQADGGTVLLDEIGELPINVQSKLLRFVQERQFTAVGSSVLRRVDVRVMAATNRDLAQEVALGRFRGDLYHRLNVIPLAIPPLRERPEDVVELARHFLEVFAPKYQKAVRTFAAGVEDALTRYAWPGNIRELQNCIMRAVIMSNGDTLTLETLSLPSPQTREAIPLAGVDEALGDADVSDPEKDTLRVGAASAPAPGPPASVVSAPVDAATAWAELRACMAAAVSAVVATPGAGYPPLGRWLENDFVLAAFHLSGEVARRASAQLGLPETTYVRRLRRAKNEAQVVRRPPAWEPVTRAVESLVRAGRDPGQDVLAIAEAVLLEAIGRYLPTNASAGASLLGTSVPTFRRRVGRHPAERRSGPNPPEVRRL